MGFAIVAGGNPNMAVPVAGIAAGDIAVGSTVKLMESGTAVEYLVVNQGIPSNSSLYDASCDGTWLLRKAIHSNRQWNSSDFSNYERSTINAWLNGDFFNTLGSVEKAAVKQVKIPHCFLGGSYVIQSGSNGLSAKVFLLSGYEVGFTTSTNPYFPKDGAKLPYFDAGTGTSANNKRIAKLDGSPTGWHLRSPNTSGTERAWYVDLNGAAGSYYATNSQGVRPALVLPRSAIFDGATMLLKGAA